MKKALSLFLAAALLLSLAACGEKEPIATVTEPPVTGTTAATAPTTVPTLATEPEEAFSFADVENTVFTFSSGAGGWRTELTIAADGSFSGVHQDSNMGFTEPEHPNGSISFSDFTGRFTEPVRVNDYTYRLQLSPLSYAIQPGTEEIREGILYCYISAYGLDQAQELLLYLPGAPLADMTEDFLHWVNLHNTELTELPFYALYDPQSGNAFMGGDPFQKIREMVTAAEEADTEAELWLQTHFTQADMNDAASARYQRWDAVLNALWAVLKDTLPEDAMRALTNEELAWIAEKERSVAEAGAEVTGGSLYPTVTGSLAAKLTRERVYELLEYLPES